MTSNFPLHNAIVQENLQLARRLVKKEAYVLMTDCEKNTPLHVLIDRFVDCSEDKPEVLSLLDELLVSGVDVNAKNKDEVTALHIACWKCCDTIELIKKLLDWGADINIKNKHKETAFEIAFRSKPQPKYCDFLMLYHHVQKLKNLDLKIDDKNNKLCKMILKKKEVWKDETDWPAIAKMFSVQELCNRQQERLQEIEQLKTVFLKDEVSLYDYLKMDVKQAALYSHNTIIKEIINNDGLKNLYKSYGYLILVTHQRSLKWLEAQKCNTEKESTEVKSCQVQDIATSTLNKMSEMSSLSEGSLYDLIKTGNVELVKKLLADGASIMVTDAKNNTLLHLAFLLKRMKIVDLILTQVKCISDYTNLKNSNGLSHFHIACARGDASVVQKFIDSKVNIKEIVNKDSLEYAGFSALQFSCLFKNLETVQVLSKAMNVLGSDTDKAGISSGELKGHIILGMCTTLIKFSHMTRENQLSEFHYACFCQSRKDVKRYLDRKAVNVNFAMNSDMKYTALYTALHFAVESSVDRQEKVKLLLKHGADANLKNSLCMTAVHLAMYNDTSQLKHNYLLNNPKEDKSLVLLYEAVKDKETNPMDAFGLTFLHIAVAVNDVTMLRKMLFRGEKVNHAVLENRRNFPKYTALHFAARYGRAEIAKLLIERGADVEGCIDDHGYDTPLQVAINYGQREMIEVLLQSNANARVVRAGKQETTIHLLAERFKEMDITCRTLKKEESRDEKAELVWCIEKLASFGVDIDAKDSDGNTALHMICRSIEGCYRCVEWLLIAGADVNVKNAGGDTPLDFVARGTVKGNYDDFVKLYHHVQRLLDLGLKVDPRNQTFCDMVLRKKKVWMHNSDWAPVREMFSNETLARKKRERHEEIENLKRDMLDANISLYDYLKMTPEAAAMFASNDRLKKIVDCDQPRVLYPIYGYLVTVQHRKILSWLAENDNENGKKTSKKTRRGKRKPT